MVPSKEVYSLKDRWDSCPTCSDRQADDRGVIPAPTQMPAKTPSRYITVINTSYVYRIPQFLPCSNTNI